MSAPSPDAGRGASRSLRPDRVTPRPESFSRAVSVFAPEVAIFVGIAGGRKDVRHGDVVAADAVYDYESGKDDEDRYLPRIKTSAPSFALVQRAQAVARRAKWPHRIKPAPPKRRPSAFVKPIAAGGKVVAHDRSNTAQLVAAYCGDALAVDMESYGFLRGAYVNDGVATLVVRGISDLLTDKTAANDERWQVVAARHAAAFAFEVLASADVAAAGSAGRPPAATWIQNNQPVGGTVYANQGGNQTIYVSIRGEENDEPLWQPEPEPVHSEQLSTPRWQGATPTREPETRSSTPGRAGAEAATPRLFS